MSARFIIAGGGAVVLPGGPSDPVDDGWPVPQSIGVSEVYVVRDNTQVLFAEEITNDGEIMLTGDLVDVR